MNPFQEIYDACNTGDSQEKYDNLPPYPRILDVELTSSCNFRCLMCPTGNLSLGRPATFMKQATFTKIILQSIFHNAAIRFIGWGEPTLHPKLTKFIEIASRHGVLTHMNTNGSKITPKFAERLVESGLRSIKFSFQGVDKASYKEMRGQDFFDEMIEAIKVMKKAGMPFISASTTTTYETQEQIDEFKRIIEPMVDQLTIGKTIFDYLDLKAVRLKPQEREMLIRLKELGQGDKNHPDPCPQVYDSLSIHADGSVKVCCNDFSNVTNLGNVNDLTIQEMWRHNQIEAYRKKLAKKDYSMPLCLDCYDYQNLTGVENA